MEINLSLILLTAFVAAVSPGPATMTIATVAMSQGRRAALATASGVTTGSVLWSAGAALGLGAVMLAHAWLLEAMRYLGAAYLLYLALKAARAAWRGEAVDQGPALSSSLHRAYGRGLVLHLTNPKAILFFGSLYSIAIRPGTAPAELLTVIAAIGVQSFLVFHLYAVLFSIPGIAGIYARLRRWFEGVFALVFGSAGIAMLSAPLR
jgi:threonine/homoserine/homoserine lactone efflux protein